MPHKSINMEQAQTFKLIEGQYTPAEAREVLLALVNSKINFNHMAAFGLEERGGKAEHHRKRVAELKDVRAMVSHLLERAQEQGCHIEVAGSFTINLVPQQTSAPQESTTVKQPNRFSDPEHYLA